MTKCAHCDQQSTTQSYKCRGLTNSPYLNRLKPPEVVGRDFGFMQIALLWLLSGQKKGVIADHKTHLKMSARVPTYVLTPVLFVILKVP